ncbi:hypothetical protein EDC56_1119 [Sinobacterium caligoides]|uniref:Hydroxylaminobenzene mutase n=1 Tax=Sinobacterium caligoides TaxID=933926 RepID=A0A3N2E0F8_9GAMM|nr:hypothetical protein [Sinobacterium caligoides]ROS05580.1 hypothetical protein EDC56_1119 [Sinobacterium caligoides]
MNDHLRKRLILHSGMVIMLGMLSGIPLAMSLLGSMATQVSDWKISHMEGLTNGLLMLAIASCASLLSLSSRQASLLFYSIVFTGYSNALYGWARGLSGNAGMDLAPPFSNQLVALLGGLPIFTAFLAIGLLMYGAAKKSA